MPGRTLWHPEHVRALASAILDDLMVDTVLTVRQIQRRHGARQDLARLACKLLADAAEYRTAGVRPAAYSYRTVRPELICLGNIRKLSRVPYLLGLAEMRTALSISPDHWSPQLSDPWLPPRHDLPAVVARDGDGLAVVEYDWGSYTRHQIIARHRVLAAYGTRVIWGVPGLRRAVSIATLLPGAEVWYISWETGAHIPVRKGGRFLVSPEVIAAASGQGPWKGNIRQP